MAGTLMLDVILVRLCQLQQLIIIKLIILPGACQISLPPICRCGPVAGHVRLASRCRRRRKCWSMAAESGVRSVGHGMILCQTHFPVAQRILSECS